MNAATSRSETDTLPRADSRQKEETRRSLQTRLPQLPLAPTTRQKISTLLAHPTLSHLVEFDVAVNSTSFIYMMDHMDAAAYLIRHFDLGDFEVHPTGQNTFAVDDREGAKAIIQRLYATSRQRILWGEGTYDSALLPVIRGQALLVVDLLPRGEERVQTRVTSYVQIHNKFLGFLIKVVTTLVPGIIDRKLERAFGVVTKLERAIHKDPVQAY
ncbi:MAG: hypothetical protein D6736_03565, partial [Nitrospinota bacterium]